MFSLVRFVENMGVEPTTSCMPFLRLFVCYIVVYHLVACLYNLCVCNLYVFCVLFVIVN